MNYDRVKVLVTGGTGSFGREMATRLLERGCHEVRIFSRDEAKQEAMRVEYAHDALKFIIGDVRSRASVDHAMRGVSHVFHAAALKQVPSCEFFPLEAVQTNVIGSSNVINSAVAHGVSRVICLSTDKAVLPINAMGMTKALMEKTAQAFARELGPEDTIVACVRYGNVMYSRGSVIPLFIGQIRRRRRITVTEPRMTRFMLTLPEAIALVDFAFAKAQQGDVFIRKAPACTVQLLAETLAQLFEVDAAIEVIGMRHGEKLHEMLASAEELRRAENMGDYFRVRLDTRDLNYAKYFTEGDPEEVLTQDYGSDSARQLDRSELRELLLSLPEVSRELEEWAGGRGAR